jgi:hypothetical protein
VSPQISAVRRQSRAKVSPAWSVAVVIFYLASCDPMSTSESSRFPVTVTRLPVTRCEVCGRTLAYRPGQASAVLTKHYNRMHPEALTEVPENPR